MARRHTAFILLLVMGTAIMPPVVQQQVMQRKACMPFLMERIIMAAAVLIMVTLKPAVLIQALVIWRPSILVTVTFGALGPAMALGSWLILRMVFSLALVLAKTLGIRPFHGGL
jgi:pheromone shutdown protein TraB